MLNPATGFPSPSSPVSFFIAVLNENIISIWENRTNRALRLFVEGKERKESNLASKFQSWKLNGLTKIGESS